MRESLHGVLLSMCLALGACGDPGDEGPNDVTTGDTPEGEVEPPGTPGANLVLTTLDGTIAVGAGFNVARVINGFDDVAVSGTSFRIRTPDADRQLAIALSAAGHPVALAWLGPGHATIDARSTVEVLVYIAIGGYHAPQGLHADLVTMLDEAPELDEFADGVSRLGFRNPDGFAEDELNSGLQAQLEDACEALLKSERVARGMLIDPSNEQSGLRLDNLGGLKEVTFTNRFRRRAHVFVERVGIIKDGIEEVLQDRVTDLPITPVTGLRDGVGTLKQIVIGAADSRAFSANEDVAYIPKTFGPIALPNVEGADRTRYRIAVVGPGDGLGATAQLRNHEAVQQYETALEFLVRDYLVPFLTDVIAPTKVVLGTEDDNAATEAIMDLLRNDPAIQDSVLSGKAGQTLQIVLGVSTAFAKLPTALLNKVVDLVIARVYGPDAAEDLARRNAITGPLSQVMRVFGGINVGLKLYDSALIERDMALSNRADLWDILVSEANVRLDPVASTIPPGDFVTLTANVVDAGEDEVFEYRFQTAGKAGTLQSALRRGNDITSADPYVTYDAREPGSDDVTVTVLLVQGSERVEIGRATATVTVEGNGVRITPEAPEVAAFGEQALTATLFGDTLPPTVTFRWTTEGALGALAGATSQEVTGTTHSVTYIAGFRPGTEEIVVEVLAPGVAEPIARSRVAVRVLPMRAAIAPTNPTLAANEQAVLTGTVTPAPPRGTLTYAWRVTGQGTIDGGTTVEHSASAATDTVTYQAVAQPTGCAQVVTLAVTYRDGDQQRELLPTSARVRVDCPVEATILAPREVVDADGTMGLICNIGDADPAGLTYAWSVDNYGDTAASIAGSSRFATLSGGPTAGDIEVVCKVYRDGALVAEASDWLQVYEAPEPPCQEAFDYAFWNSENYGMQMAVSGKLGGRATVDVFVPYWPQDYYSIAVYIARGIGEPIVTGPDGPLSSNVDQHTVYTDVRLDDGGAKVRVSGAIIDISSRGSVHIEMDTSPLDPACETSVLADPCCPYMTYDTPLQQFVLSGPLVVAVVTTGVGSGRSGGTAVGVLQSE